MNSIRVTLGAALVAMLLLPQLASAQSGDGSIEASWNRADSRPATQERVVVPPPPKPKADGSGMEYTNTAWDANRSPKSRPWPKLTSSSSARDYFDANTAVIDSLTSLYCISSNYISTLRIRNQQAMQGRSPRLKEFDYEGEGQPAPTASARTSLQALNKELMQLLERCLVGR